MSQKDKKRKREKERKKEKEKKSKEEKEGKRKAMKRAMKRKKYHPPPLNIRKTGTRHSEPRAGLAGPTEEERC